MLYQHCLLCLYFRGGKARWRERFQRGLPLGRDLGSRLRRNRGLLIRHAVLENRIYVCTEKNDYDNA